jgi:ABC-type transport system involved in multi-copper enzyme maturation permease subunit
LISLLRSELLRIRSRRMISILLIAGVTGITIIGVILAVKSHKPTAAELADVHARYQQDLSGYQHELNDCLHGTGNFQQGGPPPSQCKQWLGTPPDESTYFNNVFSLSALPDALLGISFILLVVAMLVGASSMGAEMSAGSVATLLAWEPRRIRVLLCRVAAVAVAVVVMTLVLCLALSLMFFVVSTLRGSTSTNTSWLHNVLVQVGRDTLMAVAISAIGVAVATVGRNTAAALGVLVGYLAIVENLLRGIRPSTTPWLLGSSVGTYISGKPMQVYLRSGSMITAPDGSTYYQNTVLTVTVAHALVVVIAYTVILTVIAAVMFKRRDIT